MNKCVEMKYTTKDVEKIIDVFSEIVDKKDSPEKLVNELMKLIDYPVVILQEFIKCMEIFEKYDETYLKNNYLGVIGYITIRLNLVETDPIDKGQQIW